MRDRLKRLIALICACLMCISSLSVFAESADPAAEIPAAASEPAGEEAGAPDAKSPNAPSDPDPVYSDWYGIGGGQKDGSMPEDGKKEDQSGEQSTIPAGETVRNEYGAFTALSDVPEGTELHVEKYSPSEDEEAQARQMAGENAYLVWLDISLTADGEKIETAAGLNLQIDLALPLCIIAA